MPRGKGGRNDPLENATLALGGRASCPEEENNKTIFWERMQTHRRRQRPVVDPWRTPHPLPGDDDGGSDDGSRAAGLLPGPST